MIFVLHLPDRPASAALRPAVRPERKACLARAADRMAFNSLWPQKVGFAPAE